MPVLTPVSAAPASPQAPAPQAAPPPTPGQLPPPFSSVAAGELPAVTLPPERKNQSSPLSQYVQGNLHDLVSASIDFYEAKDKHSVFFNPTRITLEQLKKADRAGDLLKIAPLIPSPKQPARPKLASFTVHGPQGPAAAGSQAPSAADATAPGAAPASDQPQGGGQPTPINPTPKPSRRLQSARIDQLKKPAPQDPLKALAVRPV